MAISAPRVAAGRVQEEALAIDRDLDAPQRQRHSLEDPRDVGRHDIDAVVGRAQQDAVQEHDVAEVDRPHLRGDLDRDRGGVTRDGRLRQVKVPGHGEEPVAAADGRLDVADATLVGARASLRVVERALRHRRQAADRPRGEGKAQRPQVLVAVGLRDHDARHGVGAGVLGRPGGLLDPRLERARGGAVGGRDPNCGWSRCSLRSAGSLAPASPAQPVSTTLPVFGSHDVGFIRTARSPPRRRSSKVENGTSGWLRKTFVTLPLGSTDTSPTSLIRSPWPSISRKSFQGRSAVGRPGPEVGPKNTFPSSALGSTGDFTVRSPMCEPCGHWTGSLFCRFVEVHAELCRRAALESHAASGRQRHALRQRDVGVTQVRLPDVLELVRAVRLERQRRTARANAGTGS